MLSRFKQYVSEQHLFPSGATVLLAVSGGRDSVCLADLMHRAAIPFAVAHCNFHLRPDDCDRDQAFVRTLAATYGVPFHTVDFDTRAEAAASGASVEEAARTLRYDFFAALCRDHDYACVATAHHRDDSVETFFLNLFRGTGLAGLHGIRPVSQQSSLTVVRPLLGFSRADIDAYIAEHGLAYVEDTTNAALDARRNRIRHQLMPLLRELYPSVDATMAANIERLYDAELLYRREVDTLRAAAMSLYEPVLPSLPFPVVYIDPGYLPAEVRSTALFELLRPYGFNGAAVADMLSSSATQQSSGRLFFSVSHVAETHRGRILIAPMAEPVAPEIKESSVRPPYPSHLLPSTIMVDADLLHRPLTLRPWQAGDRFHPFGMQQSRLVSDFLKDLHLPRIEKQQVHLLVDADGRVVWVVGLRADDRFKVTAGTKQVVEMSI